MAEKFATIAQIVAGGGNSWTDVYQAYHRLLTWHEHTNAIEFIVAESRTDACMTRPNSKKLARWSARRASLPHGLSPRPSSELPPR